MTNMDYSYFVANGDYAFPFRLSIFLAKHFYVWSSQTGSLSFDGLLRIVAKSPLFVLFGFSDNVVVSYFYILSVFALLTATFFSFLGYIKVTETVWQRLILALLFSLNPIFLGNTAKLGLVFGVAMLPVLFQQIDDYFKTYKIKNIIVALIALNISLIHPYILIVNSGFAVLLFIYKLIQEKGSLLPKRVMGHGFLFCVIALVLNAYFLLPLISTGFVIDKGAVLNDVGSVQRDYSELVRYSNTGDLLTAFSFSKNVFKDFDFYDHSYRIPYFFFTFLMYVIFLLNWLLVKKRLQRRDAILLGVGTVTFCILLLLSTGTFLNVDTLIKSVIRLPGGWSFRSPLKWQFYIPFFFVLSLAVVLKYKTKIQKASFIILLLALVGSSTYIAKDVYDKLIMPRHITYFETLDHLLDDKSILFVLTDDAYQDFSVKNNSAFVELNQILSSTSLQVKQISAVQFPELLSTNIKYLLSFHRGAVFKGYRNIAQYVGGEVTLFQRVDGKEYIYALGDTCGALRESQSVFLSEYNLSGIEKDCAHLARGRTSLLLDETALIDRLFDHVTESEINVSSSTLRESIPTPVAASNSFSLYQNFRNPTLRYSVKNGLMTFDTKDETTTYVNGKKISFEQRKEELRLSLYARYGVPYFLDASSTLIALNTRQGVDHQSLFVNKQSYALVSAQQNLIPNSSFESGSWNAQVTDCSKTDENGAVFMRIDTAQFTDGKQSLALESIRHTACVSTDIANLQGGEYVLSFDYKTEAHQKVGYYLQLKGPKNEVVQDYLFAENSDWHTFVRKVVVPIGVTSAKIYLYGYAGDGKARIVTNYDRISFSKLQNLQTIALPMPHGYERVPITISLGENVFEYKDTNYTYKNLFLNPSFEESMWQSTVVDCNNYDQQGMIGMATTTQEKTDGLQSLELSATRHTACTMTTIPVKSGSQYLLSFDYQSPNAKNASYYIGFNDQNKTSQKSELPISNRTWKVFSDTVVVPQGATTLSIFVYAKETDKKTNIINRYDNFKLIEVPDLHDAFYLVSEPTTTLKEPKSITFDLLNPTKKQVHIKGATTSFFLGMSESYHDQWQLQIRNDKISGVLNGWWPFAKPDRVGDAYHYKLDGFLNAWYVDTDDLCVNQQHCTKNADGSYDLEMTIEFWPQRWFYLGLLISGTTLVSCVSYLAFDGVRTFRRKRKAKQELL